MLAAPCICRQPQVYADSPEACHRCGHATLSPVTASTMRLAIAIAEVALGYRKVGDRAGGTSDPRTRRGIKAAR